MERMYRPLSKMKFYPLFFRNDLHIGWRSYSVEKLQCEGEYELTDVAQRAKYEAEWVFSSNSNLWFYSRSKHIEDYDRKFFLEMDLYREKIFWDFKRMNSKLTHYHIHPSFANDCLLKIFSRKKPVAFEGLNDDQLLGIANLFASIPSVGDVRYFVHTYNFPFDEFGIATEKGITKVSFGEGPVDVRISHKFEQEWSGKRFRKWFVDNIGERTDNFESLVDKLTDELNKDITPINLRFIPKTKP